MKYTMNTMKHTNIHTMKHAFAGKAAMIALLAMLGLGGGNQADVQGNTNVELR